MKSEKRRTVLPPVDREVVSPPIWWLASYPKSGNTWLRMFLTAYSTHGRCDINSPGIVTSDQTPQFYQMTTSKPFSALNQCELHHLRPAMLQNLVALYPRRPIYIKTHNCCSTVDDIPLIPPALSMGATYIIRDPRDVCVSYANHMGTDIDHSIDMMTDSGHRNGDAPILYVVSRWDAHVETWATSKIKVGIVRYEDLLENPQDKFSSILRHMGIPVVDSYVYYAVGASSFESLKSQEEESGFREKTKHQDRFFRLGRSGAWLHILSKKQRDRIEKEFGPTMEKFGYV